MNTAFSSKNLESSVIHYSLVAWIVYGFASLLDNTMVLGCIIDDRLFSLTNIAYSMLSLSLLIGSLSAAAGRFGKWLAFLETVIWLFKLFFIKGGYIVGIAGSVSEPVLLYDFVGLCLRLLLFRQLFVPTWHWVVFILMSVCLITLKLTYFT